LKELGGHKEATDMSAKGWVSDFLIGSASGAAMGVSRFVTTPSKKLLRRRLLQQWKHWRRKP
jgi:hypothetical protein